MDSNSPPPSHHHHNHPQNWLGFSLSNHFSSPPHNSHLSLFDAFNSSPETGVNLVASDHHQDAHAGATETNLSIFSGVGPKLEDFLGGGSTTTSTAGGSTATSDVITTASAAPTSLTPFSSTNDHLAVPENEIYDSELKTIAASFLRGFSTTATATSTTTLQQAKPQTQIHHPVGTTETATAKKTVDTFGQRTSIYRGVTRHRWTGRYEAHLWDNSCRREGQSRKGRQVYLGGYDKEDKAARAYDLAALKYWGPTTTTNFPVTNYEKELTEMKNMSRQEFVASLRRKSSGFSRGASIYRGVTRHHQHGRWQARIGRVAGNKDLYLGTFSTQEEAAEAYDIAAIKFRGLNAVTNFDMSRYDVKSIASSNLPIGGMSGKSKNSSDQSLSADSKGLDDRDISSASSVTFATSAHQPSNSSTLSFAIPIKQDPSREYWSNIFGYPIPSNHPSLNNPRNPNSVGAAPGYYHSNMDFSAASSAATTTSETNNGLFYGGGYNVHGQQQQQQQQQQQSTSSGTNNSSPFSTPLGLSSSMGYDQSSSSGYGTWIGPSLNLFQTPIFGME
ncbi:AP2-like ethylene-responsive transcription factor AIL5 [Argentina anserina]|uniref:AP2-like ethylene-responsive transcription factor AIL5 n=1 Tax=Argentina anserina TaxID=57926 RepID=UPI0021765FB5|nr:AP2-like ethylene-responsive transcription factor AIL5 [Potentilla anserina]